MIIILTFFLCDLVSAYLTGQGLELIDKYKESQVVEAEGVEGGKKNVRPQHFIKGIAESLIFVNISASFPISHLIQGTKKQKTMWPLVIFSTELFPCPLCQGEAYFSWPYLNRCP